MAWRKGGRTRPSGCGGEASSHRRGAVPPFFTRDAAAAKKPRPGA